ncbi:MULTISPECIES: 3'-5' exonuclease [Vibrio]|uniref:3'-5' exonuclease n=1 Tax=Vibrio TaxID=662 RepID=UPI001C307CB7|nr:3'-5' exonuclease [Vibrio metschnikovii]
MQEYENFLLEYPFIPRRFIVIDVETTGLNADFNEIIEIGAILFDLSGENHVTYNSLIKPSIPIPTRITNLTGITQKMVDAEGADLRDEMAFLKDFIGDLPIVAYNAKFDMRFIKKGFSLIGHRPKNKIICAFEMAKKAWDLSSYKLADVADRFYINSSGAHRALKDCELAGLVYVGAARVLGKAS